MPDRRLPVRPDLDQLHRQAKERLRDMHAGGHATAKLADAQVRWLYCAVLDGGFAAQPGTWRRTAREYRAVTPLSWGEQFHAKVFVSRESTRLIEARGGGR